MVNEENLILSHLAEGEVTCVRFVNTLGACQGLCYRQECLFKKTTTVISVPARNFKAKHATSMRKSEGKELPGMRKSDGRAGPGMRKKESRTWDEEE